VETNKTNKNKINKIKQNETNANANTPELMCAQKHINKQTNRNERRTANTKKKTLPNLTLKYKKTTTKKQRPTPYNNLSFVHPPHKLTTFQKNSQDQCV